MRHPSPTRIQRQHAILLACILTAIHASTPIATALGPHEILLLVNTNSPDSIRVADEFAARRQLPAPNRVELGLPDSTLQPPYRISPEDFTRSIWEPASHIASERKINDHILAWVYSCGFPTAIEAHPVISITGLTFLRNRMPSPENVRKEKLYASRLFAGPNRLADNMRPSQTFDMSAATLRQDFPLPSMMLGFTGNEGNSPDQILACIAAGVSSDYTAPQGTVYFATNSDIRSTCRHWLFPYTQRRLESYGMAAVILPQLPVMRNDVFGLMCGTANINADLNNRFLPGAFADHLTSAAATFHSPGQTKISSWLAAGATASAGTVTEPFSAWMKFPSASLFIHYTAGCTMLESIYQSLSCPLEILPIGEPLAQPWAVNTIFNMQIPNEPLSGAVSLSVSSSTQRASANYKDITWFVDGQTAGKGWKLQLDTDKYPPGTRELRAVAYRVGFVRCQSFVIRYVSFAGPISATKLANPSSKEPNP